MKKFSIPQKGKIIATLNNAKDSFPTALRKLSIYLMNNPEAAVRDNLSEIAAGAGVGEATAIRLAKLLGFTGFHDFRIELTVELTELNTKNQDSANIIDDEIDVQDSPAIVGRKIAGSVSSALGDNLDMLDEKALQGVVNAISKAGYVLIFGMGNSGLCASFIKNKLARIGINAITEMNSHFMYTEASLLHPGDVAIAISRTGTVYETVKSLYIAKQAGATCVSITHNTGSAMAKKSDYVLYSGNNESSLQSDSIGTIAAQLHICEIIYNMLVQTNFHKAQKTKQLTLDALKFKI